MSKDSIPAGNYLLWVDAQTTRPTSATAQLSSNPNVPCGECNACCKSAYFIHIEKHETQTLKKIPKELLFAAPGQAKGNMLMGFDEQGKCPMLISNACSIYQHRPQTCREYDCRIFAAAGIPAGPKEKNLVNTQLAKWRFDHQQPEDESGEAARAMQATQRAARLLENNKNAFDPPINNPTQIALLALSLHRLLLTEKDVSDTDAVQLFLAELSEQRQTQSSE